VTSAEVLLETYGRIYEIVHEVLADADEELVNYQIDPQSNSIGWLIWHLTRVQDHHIAQLAGRDQVFVVGGFARRFALPDDEQLTGYGQKPAEVSAFRVKDPALLAEYYDTVHAGTLSYLQGLDDGALDEVIDRSWDPPVTRGVRLVSVLADDLQHAGQAAYVKGCGGRAR
jgi:uncharacterized damage-inducible protein DinB